MNSAIATAIRAALERASGVELAPPVRSDGATGRRIGRGHGNALEFSEYREYRAGDDLRRLDWRVFARSEQLMVKLFADEVDPRCDLVIDCSASMGIAPAKTAGAAGLAAIFAQGAVNAGFSLNAWCAHDELLKLPDAASPLRWELPEFDGGLNPSELLHAGATRFQPRGVRVLFSDLLFPESPDTLLAALSAGARRVAVIQLLSAADAEPEFSGAVSLLDPESGEERELTVDDTALRRYAARLAVHRELWARAAAGQGATLLSVRAEKLAAGWELENFFQQGLFK